MPSKSKKHNLWGLIVIAAILSGLSYWTFQEVADDYISVERSNTVVAALLENDTRVIRNYSRQLNDMKKSLAIAEDKLTQAESDNANLKSQMTVMADVNDLEQKIAELQAANGQLRQSIETAATESRAKEEMLATQLQEYVNELEFMNVNEGRDILVKYKKKIHAIKSRIKNFMIQDRNNEIAAKKADDEAKLSLGNNGYLLRDGKQAPPRMGIPQTNSKNHVQIDVKFVK